jgi:hypothetical protein
MRHKVATVLSGQLHLPLPQRPPRNVTTSPLARPGLGLSGVFVTKKATFWMRRQNAISTNNLTRTKGKISKLLRP